MTKKDYIILAKVINSVVQDDAKNELSCMGRPFHIDRKTISIIVNRLGVALQADNETFDTIKFDVACYKR